MDDGARVRYLRAMGIDAYVARRPLPGAAPSRPTPVPPAPARTAEPAVARPRGRTAQAGPATGDFPAPAPAAGPVRGREDAAGVVRFRLAAVFAGGVAWVEDLGVNPLASEQVQLVHAMARALGGALETPRVAQFDWPVHNNPQLDQGMDAARDAVQAFLQRHLDEQVCRGLVLLGADCERYVDAGHFSGVPVVSTRGTLEMLREPALKRQVWRDLQVLVAAG